MKNLEKNFLAILKDVNIKATNDNRKTVRIPKELYKRLTENNPQVTKYKLISKALKLFKSQYEIYGNSIIEDFGELETIPIKVSNEDYRVIKVLKFESDKTYINIIASAISYYLEILDKGAEIE